MKPNTRFCYSEKKWKTHAHAYTWAAVILCMSSIEMSFCFHTVVVIRYSSRDYLFWRFNWEWCKQSTTATATTATNANTFTMTGDTFQWFSSSSDTRKKNLLILIEWSALVMFNFNKHNHKALWLTFSAKDIWPALMKINRHIVMRIYVFYNFHWNSFTIFRMWFCFSTKLLWHWMLSCFSFMSNYIIYISIE